MGTHSKEVTTMSVAARGRIDLIPDMRNARRFNKLPGLMKHVRVIHGRLIESYLYNRGW